MRSHLLLLFFAFATPALALRGEKRKLQLVPVGESKDAEPKDLLKQGEEKKDDKKKDNECKRPSKNKKKKQKDGRRNTRRLQLQKEKEGLFETRFCLHGFFDDEQCADIKKLPKDATLRSELKMEILRPDTQESDNLVDNIKDILDNDTNPRFVGCRSLRAEAHKKGDAKKASKDAAAKDANSRYLKEEYELVFEEEKENVDVTGVEFNDLQVLKNACQNAITPPGKVCDVVESSVDIYYQFASTTTDDDKEDMKNLLIETIFTQAEVGSFSSVGSVESVKIDGSSTETKTETKEETLGSDEIPEEEGTSFLPYVGAAAGAILAFGVAYWYGTSGEDDPKEKNDDTSDEEDEHEQNKEPIVATVVKDEGGWFGSAWNKEDEKLQEASGQYFSQ